MIATSKDPLVSIILNNYNYGCYLKQSIDSALNQTYGRIEVIVVDDGSEDKSLEVINSYADNSIIPILKDNAGQASAFNAGFLASSGEIVCLLDSDDFFYPSKISRIVEAFANHPSIGWIFHKLTYVDKQSALISMDEPKNSFIQSARIDWRSRMKKGARALVLPATGGLCIRREILGKILPMPESRGVTISDNYIKYASLAISPGFLFADRLAAQRIHGKNIYTFQENWKLRSEINIKTGYYLRKSYPEIQLFADKLFSQGCGEMLAEMGIKRLIEMPEFKKYLQGFMSASMVAINFPKIIIHAIRFKLRRCLLNTKFLISE
ncbi:MAG: glycosyltransferase family 2 protein [Leptolyngbyaceae cyanobacterium]